MTKEQFLEIQINQISQVYNGKDNCCRCGCGGNYVATSYMNDPRSVVDDALIQKRLNKAKKLILSDVEHSIGSTYINIVTGNNRCLTFYFDELKPIEP